MRIEFDQEADALYVQIHEAYVAHIPHVPLKPTPS